MSDEMRDESGARLCAWCGEPVRQSGVGRTREYCRRSCRQRAYEERQILRRIAVANQALRMTLNDKAVAASPVPSRDDVGRAVPPSRDELGTAEDSSRDDSVSPGEGARPVPAPARRTVGPWGERRVPKDGTLPLFGRPQQRGEE